MPVTVSIGRLQFDPDGLVLYDAGQVVPLAPLPAQMLAALVRARGDVVSTGWLRELLWDGAPVEDRNLNQQIYVLRRALRRDPRVAIENVPRRGYRLVVTPVAATAESAKPPVAGWRGRTAFAWRACVVALALAAIFLEARQAPPLVDASDRDVAMGNYLATSEGPNHLERAAQYFRDLVDREPRNAAGYGGLAVVDVKRALNVSDLPSRERLFETSQVEAAAALRLNAGDSNALTAIGIVASVRDHCPDTAQRMFDAAVAADPNGESPRTWRARFLMSIGKIDEAGRDFRALGQNVPTSGYAVGSFGEWLVLKRDYVRASDVLAQAVDLGNHPGFTRYWLARAYYKRGLYAQALRLSNVLLAMYPNEASALVLRLRVEAQSGDMRAALADYNRVAQIPDVAQTDPVALASADVAMGKRAQALRTVQQYVASGVLDIDEMARLRTDPDLDALRKDSGKDAATVL
jgi:DNA-binding winged helix-turn-helix (wHTH) protein